MFVERMEVLEYRQKFVRKSLSVDILRKSWPIWMKITVYVANGVESRTSPNQYSRTIISP